MVYANQALVNAADLTTMNGVVHSIDAVILPVETVVDIALDNGFTTLAAAVVQAELLPALCDPLATYTVFAPTNQAFDDLAAALNTDLNGLLALPNLADVLTYHVLGAVVPSADVTNGLVAQPLSNTNSLKFTVTGNSSVYVNHATVTATDIYSENGVVHVLDKVVLPFETIADIAIDNGFTSLTAAVIEAELLPVLTDPFANLTVFAPTNQAFDDLATALGTDINGVLASPNLTEILLYHVLGSVVLSTDLSNGSVPTVNGQNVDIMVGNPVMINDAEVLLADLQANNGVVHVIDAVLVPSLASLTSNSSESFEVYPNPSSGSFRIKGGDFEKVALIDLNGREIANYSFVAGHETIEVDGINPGLYIVLAEQNGKILSSKIQIQ